MDDIKIQCQYCGQFKNEDGTWDGQKQPLIRVGRISHGMCPECFDREMAKIEAMK